MIKVKDGYIMQKIGDDNYAVYVGSDSKAPAMLHLNEVATLLFSRLTDGCERAELVSAVLDEYDVSPERAEADVDMFVSRLESEGLI